jgi:hypothetical protein
VKSLALLHLPSEKLEPIVAKMSLEEKKSLIHQAFETPRIRETDLDMLDQSLAVIIHKEEKQDEGVFHFPSLIPNLLNTLSPYEEILLVRDFVNAQPESAQFLKSNYPALGFLGEWPQEMFRNLLTHAKTQEIVALVQVMPELRSLILSVLPPRLRTIVEDEVGRRELKVEELNGYLGELRLRIHSMVSEGEVDLTQIFANEFGTAKDRSAA